MSKFRKNNTKKALLFTLAFAVIIAGALAVTLLTDWNPLGNLVGPTQEDPGKTEPENPQPDNMVDVEPNDPEPELPVTFNIPDRMRAVTILPGEDYLTEKNEAADSVKKEIDAALDAAKDLGMNTVLVGTSTEDFAAYESLTRPTVLANPKLMIFGAAAQFGIFFTLCTSSMFFDIKDAASIATIGAADGPTAIVVAQMLDSKYLGAIMVAAYSYMALVPIIQPPVIKLLTTEKERKIRMKYKPSQVSKLTKILFPIVITIIAGVVSPNSVALVGFLMFGNLIRECGVLDSLSETAQRVLANLVTIFLGITIATQMQFDKFLRRETLLILGLGFIAFIFDTAGGVIFAKFLNLFLKEKINPMIGAAGISAFPMSGRVVHKMGLAEDPQNFLLMQSMGVNVSGQIASVIAGGLILNFFA